MTFLAVRSPTLGRWLHLRARKSRKRYCSRERVGWFQGRRRRPVDVADAVAPHRRTAEGRSDPWRFAGGHGCASVGAGSSAPPLSRNLCPVYRLKTPRLGRSGGDGRLSLSSACWPRVDSPMLSLVFCRRLRWCFWSVGQSAVVLLTTYAMGRGQGVRSARRRQLGWLSKTTNLCFSFDLLGEVKSP